MDIINMFYGNDINSVISGKSEFIKEGRIYEISPTNGKRLACFMFLVSFFHLLSLLALLHV